MKFTVLNREVDLINAIVGMEIIPEPNGSYGLETIKYYDSEGIVSTFRQGEDNMVGYRLLSGQFTTVYSIDWYDGYSLIDDSLYNWMTKEYCSPSLTLAVMVLLHFSHKILFQSTPVILL